MKKLLFLSILFVIANSLSSQEEIIQLVGFIKPENIFQQGNSDTADIIFIYQDEKAIQIIKVDDSYMISGCGKSNIPKKAVSFYRGIPASLLHELFSERCLNENKCPKNPFW